MRVFISPHCAYRLVDRGAAFGLDEDELRRRLFETLKSKTKSHKHNSKGRRTFARYFSDNTTLYAICQPLKDVLIVKTVMIERGR